MTGIYTSIKGPLIRPSITLVKALDLPRNGKKGIERCHATVIYKIASKSYVPGRSPHTCNGCDAELIRKRNQRQFLIHQAVEIVCQQNDEAKLTPKSLIHHIMELGRIQGVTIFESPNDIAAATRIAERRLNGLSGSLTSSRLPERHHLLKGIPFLRLESSVPPILLFTTDNNIRIQNSTDWMIILPVKEGYPMSEGFDHLYAAFSVTDKILPCFWLLCRKPDDITWSVVTSSLMRMHMSLDKIKNLVLGFSESYTFLGNCFSNPELKIYTIDTLVNREFTKCARLCGIEEDDTILNTIVNFNGDREIIWNAFKTNIQKNAKYKLFAKAISRLLHHRHSWLCGERIITGHLAEIVQWADALAIPEKFDELIEMIHEIHTTTSFNLELRSLNS